MKGITPIIGVIILVLIVVALGGTGYTFLSGQYEAVTSKTIKVAPVHDSINTFVVQNFGSSTIEPGELTITVEGKESVILNPQPIPPKQNMILKFNPAEIREAARVRIVGPTNVQNLIINTEGNLYRDLVMLHHADFDFSDASEFGNDGFAINLSENNVSINTAGCIGGAYEFDGFEDAVGIMPSPELDVLDNDTLPQFTLAMWVFLGRNDVNQVLFSQDDDGSQSRVWLRFQVPDDIDTILAGGQKDMIRIYPTAAEWHHVTLTFNGSHFTGFLDSVRNNSVTDSSSIDEDATGFYKLGAAPNNTTEFTGLIDEIGLWNRVLSQAEINQLYQMGAGC